MHTPYILTRAWPAASLRTLTAAMKPSILPILSTAAARPAALPGWPLLRLGFRPFYLGAAVFACLALPLWLALSLGWVSLDLDLAPLRALHAALAGIVMIECVMAGRVIPAFTNAVTPGLNLKIQPRVEQVTLALTALALAAGRDPPTSDLVDIAGRVYLDTHRFCAAGSGAVGLGQRIRRCACAGRGRHRRPDHRHGHPHRTRPHWPAAGGLARRGAGLRAGDDRGRAARAAAHRRAAQWLVLSQLGAALAWSTAFARYLAVFTPWLLTTRLDGKDG